MTRRKRKARAYSVGPAAAPDAPNLDGYRFDVETGELIAAAYHDATRLFDRAALSVEIASDLLNSYPRQFVVHSPSLGGPALGWVQSRFETGGLELPPNSLRVWSPDDDEVYSYTSAPISGGELGWVINGAGYLPGADYLYWIEREDGGHQVGTDWFTRFRLRRGRPHFGGSSVVTLSQVDLAHPDGREIVWGTDGVGDLDYLGVASAGFQLDATVARLDESAWYPGHGPGQPPFAIVFPLDGSAPTSSFDDGTFGAVDLRAYYGTPGLGGLCLGRETFGDGHVYSLTLSVAGAAELHLEGVEYWGLAGDRIGYYAAPTLRVASGETGLDVEQTIELPDAEYAYWRPA